MDLEHSRHNVGVGHKNAEKGDEDNQASYQQNHELVELGVRTGELEQEMGFKANLNMTVSLSPTDCLIINRT